ncbi:MAG: acyl-CoA thioesterase [Deltaproteobacteria bacterium]|nr:acyl-CoA thioesterase [Deltaproteobacteria bacterium]
MSLTAKLASGSHVEMTQLVMPGDGNIHGTTFGGRIMQWIDLCAAMASQRHCRMPVVTASIDRLDFLGPVRIGEMAVLHAQVNAVFGTSMEVGCEVWAENPISGERRKCCDSFLTFVALGPDGKPARAPLLLTASEEEAARATAAQERRSTRLAQRPRRQDPSAPVPGDPP